jgi:hypothetical protein
MSNSTFSVSYSPFEYEEYIRYNFIANTKNTICEESKYINDESLYDFVIYIIELLKKLDIEDVYYNGIYSDSIIINGKGVYIYTSKSNANVTQSRHGIIQISITGYPHIVKYIFDILNTKYRAWQQGQLKFWYNKNGPTSTDILLDSYGTHYPEFYPWLPSGFMNEYLKSSASILFLCGEPGTGKTSVLRNLICSRQLHASVTYDENLLYIDEMFLNFITSSDMNLIIIEDADNLLSSREKFNNPLISRFLNFSDGLIKFPSKKIIFTTNINDFNNIDEALTRSGRCFGILEARKLTFEEAVKAAEVASLPVPTIVKEYTISDLINHDYKVEEKSNFFKFRS